MKPIKRFDGELYRRQMEAIAHGALTNSKRAETFVREVYPTTLKRGFGCYVYDSNDNQYIDFICGLGSNLLGYAQDDIVQACEREIRNGGTLSLGTELEIECAERLKAFVPYVERWRFLKTGSDACTGASTIARSYTKKRLILSEGYHGWHPEFVSLTPPANGVVQHNWISLLDNDDLDLDEVAAVIVEPVITDNSKERIAFLRHLRDECTKAGTLLIFDEVITGFRYPNFTVSREHDIVPDLICMGKAIGGGMSLSAIGGKQDIMESDYFVSSTFAGERLPFVASIETMKLLGKAEYQIGPLWLKGGIFLQRFNEIWSEALTLEGYPTRSALKGSSEHKALFMQECCKAGILIGPSFFFNYKHVDVMDGVLSTFKDIMGRIRLGEVKLEGQMPVSPFSERARR